MESFVVVAFSVLELAGGGRVKMTHPLRHKRFRKHLKFLRVKTQDLTFLQSQLVYYCFVDCVTKENLTYFLMSGLNQYESLNILTKYFVIFTVKFSDF